uniref:Uncharacterized protein n=1 Tax=Moniliophthora roreri TaxID=221103 RepID=A0A0W0ETN8_MONRR
MSYLMGQKGDTSPSDLTLEFFSGRMQKPPSHISNSFDNFPACSPSLRALTEVPLPSQLGIPRTIFINSRLLTSNHHHLASASPEHPSLSGFITETSSVVFCLPFSRIIYIFIWVLILRSLRQFSPRCQTLQLTNFRLGMSG